VQGSPPELAFNLAPVAISDWSDRETETVVVPAAMAKYAVHHKVNRSLKHVSVSACVSGAGEILMPHGITSQDSTRIH
jgi:hypothetical protein